MPSGEPLNIAGKHTSTFIWIRSAVKDLLFVSAEKSVNVGYLFAQHWQVIVLQGVIGLNVFSRGKTPARSAATLVFDITIREQSIEKQVN